MKATDEQILAALRKHNGSRTLAANEVGLTQRVFYARLSRLKSGGQHVPQSLSPTGPILTGTSTLYNEKGAQVLQWVKEKVDEKQQHARIEAAARACAERIQRVAPLKAPKAVNADLCSL